MHFQRFALVLLLLVAPSTLAVAGQPEAETIGLYRQAAEKLRSGDADAAIPFLEKVVANAPHEPFPAYMLAKAFAMKANGETSLKWFRKAVELGALASMDILMEIETDPSLKALRELPGYMATVDERLSLGDAPELEAFDLDANPVKLSDLRGHSLLLVFWSIDCGVCHIEFDALQKNAAQLRQKGLRVVAVAPDSAEEQKAHIEKGNWEFTFWRSDPARRTLPLLYAVTSEATPANFFIDPTGRIVRFYRGYSRQGNFDFAIDLTTTQQQ